MGGLAYTWMVEEDIEYTVYGYNSSLAESDTTNALMESVTMKDMSGKEYKGIDVNVRLDGWLASCNEYGDDVEAAWERIEQ